MKPYKLKFLPAALKEWNKLGSTIRLQFKKKLKERLKQFKIASAKLIGFQDVYKIKLRSSVYRLAYQVREQELTIIVVAVGKREKDKVYLRAKKRL
ncbi:type II toxin-antitoxin system mRNA interferase toxin, RelE/StbE family [candidate division KSB1 bacterium]|nr:MAG: type II toxin-antitoxin system mRNA interferase toxin, RelE/StbE family [candidate division KSB1 bacterium]